MSPPAAFPSCTLVFHKLFRYVQRRQAHGITSWYFDRRDSYKWWTFWAVIWIGGLSVVLSIIQMAIAGASLQIAKDSLYYAKLSVNATDSWAPSPMLCPDSTFEHRSSPSSLRFSRACSSVSRAGQASLLETELYGDEIWLRYPVPPGIFGRN